MRETIVHIGGGKCGSTAIQDALVQHLDFLTEQGIALLVPSDLADLNAVNMATYLSHQRESEAHVFRSRRVRPVPDAEARIARLRDRIAALGAERLIISNEYFADVHPGRHADRLGILKRLLPEDGSKLTLIYYVRKPDNIFVSLYLQWFLPDLPVSMDRFYREFDFAGAGESGLSLDWYRQARAIEDCFPHARVVIRVYEQAASCHIARDFCEAAGIRDLPPTFASPRSNVSLRGLGYQFQARLGRFLPAGARRRLYRALLRTNPRTRFDAQLLLSTRKRRRILDYYAANYIRLFEEFGAGSVEDLERLWDIRM